MKNLQNVRDILEAIEAVEAKAKAALEAGDKVTPHECRDDLITLQKCLIGPVTAFLEEFEKDKKVA